MTRRARLVFFTDGERMVETLHSAFCNQIARASGLQFESCWDPQSSECNTRNIVLETFIYFCAGKASAMWQGGLFSAELPNRGRGLAASDPSV